METLRDLLPDVDVLVGLPPEELARYLLRLARSNLQNGMFNPDNLVTVTTGVGMAAMQASPYPPHRAAEVELAVNEAWQWLWINMLIVSVGGYNGRSGFMTISRRGLTLTDDQRFDSFRDAAGFPKSLLHPAIADQVWLALARGDLEEAVFTAFKAVEVAVRLAGGYDPTDIGVPLMRKAFDEASGPLTDPSQPKAEREALAHLFAGAIGSYKNPHSHRTVSITDPREAQEIVMLASHLLRIVDSRRNAGS
jgi:uncharacterized protein (TIGR02391 family)